MFKGARGQSGCTRFGAPILPKDGETHLGRRWVCTPVLDYTHFVRTLVCGAFQMKSKVAPIFLHLSLLEMGAQLYFNSIAQRAVRRAWTQAQHEQMEKRKSTNRKWKSWAEARIKIGPGSNFTRHRCKPRIVQGLFGYASEHDYCRFSLLGCLQRPYT